MKTITKYIENEYIIKNSRFITIIYPLKELSEINNYLNKAKITYPKATHYTYAYVFADIKKASDDNEPSGTAGIPMLSILEKENLDKVLAITIRYFGGIKLGAGGLVRAYSKSLKMALDKANIKELIKGYLIELTFSYNDQNKISNLIKDMTILQKEYLKDIKYLVEIPLDKINILNNYKYKIIKEIEIINQ